MFMGFCELGYDFITKLVTRLEMVLGKIEDWYFLRVEIITEGWATDNRGMMTWGGAWCHNKGSSCGNGNGAALMGRRG